MDISTWQTPAIKGSPLAGVLWTSLFDDYEMAAGRHQFPGRLIVCNNRGLAGECWPTSARICLPPPSAT